MKLTKRKQIKPKNYYLQLSCFLIHLGVIIYFIIRLKPSQFFPHLTNWSFVLSSVYLFVLLICDIFLSFFSKDNLGKINYYFRNIFSKVVFPYNFLISLTFWILLIIGFISPVDTFLEKDQEITIEMIFINSYVHLVITIFLLIDLFLNERDIIKLNPAIFIVNTIIFIVYGITLITEKYVLEFYPYLFMKNINVLEMIPTFSGIYGLLIASIFIYKSLTNRINKKKNNGEELIDFTDNKDNKDDIGANEEG